MFELREVRAGYFGREVLHGISQTLEPGTLYALIGPNGCGKSTLLRVAAGLRPPSGGQVLLDGRELDRYEPKQLARRLSYLPQTHTVPSISARRMVLHGRFPYLSFPRRYSPADLEAVERALALTDCGELADHMMPDMSGGQCQRVYLAMQLAQETEILLLDEPATYLDVGHQLALMELAQRLAAEGKTVVAVLHDLCLAMRFAGQILVLSEGVLAAQGSPDEIMDRGILDRVFRVRLRRTAGEDGWHYYL